MNQAVLEMLQKYPINSSTDAGNALKEIVQEIALLGLHRSNFFEKAAFYGGTALRILYSLPRYSEDLDFTLFAPNPEFTLTPYFSAIGKELMAYGFQTEIERVEKKKITGVESAFIKTNTKTHLLKIEPLKNFSAKAHSNSKLQIKFEVDIDPVTEFEYEARYLLAPTSFPVISLKKPDLFGGKLHALLFRKWKNRVKGRDYYDYIWYLKNNIPVRLNYLRQKSIQSGHCNSEELQNIDQLKNKLSAHFKTVNFDAAKADVMPFIKNPEELSLWNADFFIQITEKLTVLS